MRFVKIRRWFKKKTPHLPEELVIEIQKFLPLTELHNSTSKVAKSWQSAFYKSLTMQSTHELKKILTPAVQQKNTSLLKELVKIAAKKPELQQEILRLAAYSQDVNLIQMYVKSGYSINLPLNKGNTVLHIVISAVSSAECMNKKKDLINYLITQGANVNAQNQDGDTPLHRMVLLNYPIEFIKLLLDYGANPMIQSSYFTLMDYVERRASGLGKKRGQTYFENLYDLLMHYASKYTYNTPSTGS